MLNILKNLLPAFSNRNRGFGSRFGRRPSALAHAFSGRRGAGIGLGSLAAIAAPFIIRKLQQRRHAAY